MAQDRAEKIQKIPQAVGPYRVMVRSGDLFFLSGQIGLNPESGLLVSGGIESQTRQVMANIKSILESEGLGLGNLVKTTIFLIRMEDFAKVNEIYGSFFSGQYPVRSTVGVSALPKGAWIEIEAIAKRS